MRNGKVRLLGALGSVIALGALVSSGAVAGAASNDGTTVIKAKANLERKKLFFDAPATVERGERLEIKNLTPAKKVGPHTFSLVKKAALPKTKNEMKGCFGAGICGQIARWHKVEFSKENEEEFTVHRPKVKVKRKGWDQLGGMKREGDSVFLDDKGDSFSQKVSAKAGKDLFYICAVHPEMQGKITVEG